MEYPIKKGKPVKAKMDNKIDATASSKSKNPKLDKSMFGESALGSSIAATKSYATKTKAMVDKSVFCLKNDTNSIFPDNKAC